MEHQRFGKGGENMKDLFEDMKKNKNNGWINCEFRLPEKGKKCLIMVEYNGVLGMYGAYERLEMTESGVEKVLVLVLFLLGNIFLNLIRRVKSNETD